MLAARGRGCRGFHPLHAHRALVTLRVIRVLRAHVLRHVARRAERGGAVGARVVPALLVHRAHVRRQVARTHELGGAARAGVWALARFGRLYHRWSTVHSVLEELSPRFVIPTVARIGTVEIDFVSGDKDVIRLYPELADHMAPRLCIDASDSPCTCELSRD